MKKSKAELFASESTIHGVRFIGNNQNHRASRFFWAASLVLSVIALTYNFYTAFHKWNYEPDIGLSVQQKFLNEIPFPAVTVCSPILYKGGLANFEVLYEALYNSQEFPNLTISERNYIAAGLQWCDPHLADQYLWPLRNRSEHDVFKLLNEMAMETNELFDECSFRRSLIKCRKILNRVLTDKSFCFSFNMQGSKTIFNKGILSKHFSSYVRRNFDDKNEVINWTLDGGYTSDEKNYIFPVRALKTNELDLSMKLPKSDAEHQCTLYKNTFLIYFHLPNEIPTPFHRKTILSFNSIKLLTLTAKSFTADKSLRDYAPTIRHCFFTNERKLKFFKSYTKAHCDYECMTNYTLKVCNCVKFSMPHDDGTPICDVDQATCHYEAMQNWPDMNLLQEGETIPCDCYPTCNDIHYSVKDESVAPYYMDLNSKDDPHYNALITIKFEDHAIEEYESFIAYRMQNFIADCGGLLGLFLGCSVLSIIELIYFTITICLRRKKKKHVVVMVKSFESDKY